MVETLPIPWSMVAEVALVDVQLNVDDSPGWIVIGSALKETEGGVKTTVTVA